MIGLADGGMLYQFREAEPTETGRASRSGAAGTGPTIPGSPPYHQLGGAPCLQRPMRAERLGNLGGLHAVTDNTHDGVVTLFHDTQLHEHLAAPVRSLARSEQGQGRGVRRHPSALQASPDVKTSGIRRKYTPCGGAVR